MDEKHIIEKLAKELSAETVLNGRWEVEEWASKKLGDSVRINFSVVITGMHGYFRSEKALADYIQYVIGKPISRAPLDGFELSKLKVKVVLVEGDLLSDFDCKCSILVFLKAPAIDLDHLASAIKNVIEG